MTDKTWEIRDELKPTNLLGWIVLPRSNVVGKFISVPYEVDPRLRVVTLKIRPFIKMSGAKPYLALSAKAKDLSRLRKIYWFKENK